MKVYKELLEFFNHQLLNTKNIGNVIWLWELQLELIVCIFCIVYSSQIFLKSKIIRNIEQDIKKKQRNKEK